MVQPSASGPRRGRPSHSALRLYRHLSDISGRRFPAQAVRSRSGDSAGFLAGAKPYRTR